MGYMKRAMALLLALVMSLCLVCSASAATSPTSAPANPGYDEKSGQDTNTQDNAKATVVSTVSKDTAVVDSVKSAGATSVNLAVARDASNKTVPITQVGTGTSGVFDTSIKKVTISSTAAEVTIAKSALSKSKVKTLVVDSASVRIKKNAFKGTKTKNPVIYINGAKKAADVKVGKGSFAGLNKKAKIVVSKKNMSKKQFNALKKKLKKKGFKGKIVRK